MFSHFWIYAAIGFVLILTFLTACAVSDIIKNDLCEGDTIFDFIDEFTTSYTGLFLLWLTTIGFVCIISFICWIVERAG